MKREENVKERVEDHGVGGCRSSLGPQPSKGMATSMHLGLFFPAQNFPIQLRV